MSGSFDLSGKSALVTGASSGLGAYFAHRLAAAGASVLLTARRQEALSKVAASIDGRGGRCETAMLDVTDVRSINALGDRLAVDILVNNAGIVHEGPALEVTEESWNAALNTNLKGMFLTAQAVAAARKGHDTSIINIASILGLRQSGNVLPYAVSKAGVIQLTKTLALELARHKIRVNAIAPGYIATDLNDDFWRTGPGEALIRRIPQRRLGQMHDLDGPLLLLASDASAYMTGSILVVDGGHLVSGL